MMSSFYSKVVRVIVWLGEEADNSDLALMLGALIVKHI